VALILYSRGDRFRFPKKAIFKLLSASFIFISVQTVSAGSRRGMRDDAEL
jgi:hypothetical protein